MESVVERIKAHLQAPVPTSAADSVAVHRKAKCALHLHTAVARATVVASGSEYLDLSALLECASQCRANDVAPPAFLAEVVESVVSRWSDSLLAHMPRREQWLPMDEFALQSTLRAAVQERLSYRSHVAAVDGNMNPNSLCEYVRCVKFIWVDNAGSFNPACVQALKKVSACTSTCAALICDYARIEASRADCTALSHAMCLVQSCVRNGFVSTGMSNSAAEDCISTVTIDLASMRALDSAALVLDEAWDFLRGNMSNVPHTTLPGLVGSHVPSFRIPKRVAHGGSPRVILNCLASALLLSRQAYGQISSLCIAANEPEAEMLVSRIQKFVNSMCRHFGSRDACDPLWWQQYKQLLQELAQSTSATLGLPPPDVTPPEARNDPDSQALTLSTLCSSKAVFEGSSIGKVREACRLFDAVCVAIGRNAKTARLTVPSLGGSVVVGKLFSDLEKIMKPISPGARLYCNERSLSFDDYPHAVNVLQLLLDYMKALCMPRRKREQNTLLKHNQTHSATDGRKRSR